MLNKYWRKGALLLAVGTVLQWGLGGGCLNAVVQRLLVSVAFD